MKRHDLFFTDEEVLLSDSTKVRMIAYKDIVFFVTDRPYVIIGTEKKERISDSRKFQYIFSYY